LVPKSVFDESVFEGMETDDHRASTGLHPLWQRNGEELVEVFELVVDGNSQGLKDTRGRVNFATSLPAMRQGAGNGRDQIAGRPVRELVSPRDDRPRDRTAGTLFPEPLKKLCQFVFVERRQEV